MHRGLAGADQAFATPFRRHVPASTTPPTKRSAMLPGSGTALAEKIAEPVALKLLTSEFPPLVFSESSGVIPTRLIEKAEVFNKEVLIKSEVNVTLSRGWDAMIAAELPVPVRNSLPNVMVAVSRLVPAPKPGTAAGGSGCALGDQHVRGLRSL